MTGEDLRTLLRSEVLADEPPFGTTSAPAIAAGRRVVRRRRLLAVAGAVGAVAVAATVGWVVVEPGGGSTMQATIPPAAQEVLDSFDPATFPTIVDAEVRAVAGDAFPAGVEPRIEPTLDGYTRLRPADHAYTDAWTAWYQLSPTDEVMVIMRHDQSANEGSATTYCEQNLASQEMERCTVDTLDDGSVVIASVSETSLRRSGYGPPTDDVDTRWFARQVVNRRDYGFGVIAREYVKAASLEEADTRWSLSTGQLTEIAGSPRLVYAMPTEPKRKCDTTFLMPRTEDGFARVVCESSLND